MKLYGFGNLLIIGLFWVWGCSERHFITLDPAVPVSQKNIGNGETVHVQVIDARKSKTIARWHDRFNLRKFTISADSDITDTLHSRISSGLELLGFQPKSYPKSTSPKALRVDVLQVKSTYHEKLPRLGVKVQAAIKGSCKSGNRKFQNTYRYSRSKQDIRPATFPNEKLVNAAVSEVLRQMFSDPGLIGCLSS